MAFDKIDQTGNEDIGKTWAKLNVMLQELYALPGASSASINAAVAAKTQIAALTTVTTPDATDLATAQALANANKAKINAIIAALKA